MSSILHRISRRPFLGLRHAPIFTNKLEFFREGIAQFPIFRVLDPRGNFDEAAQLVSPSEARLDFGSLRDPKSAIAAFDLMVTISAYDSVLYEVQRQGRISFYMQNSGEEGLQIASAAALEPVDLIWPQYRELGVFLYRGFTAQMVTDQCASVSDEVGRGRQMPVHYCFPDGNIQAVTSPIATQLPQAAGAGYSFRLDKEAAGNSSASRVSVAYFGEGASSEGDFAVALNFAAVLKSQAIFICRNNGYAISTPANEQFASDGVAPRGPAYGVATARVDGNDVFAVYAAVREARRIAVSEGPVLLELMTYRRGHHSTSDDATRYRPKDEEAEYDSPIQRFGAYLQSAGLIDKGREDQVRKEKKTEILNALKKSESKKRGKIADMFKDVYAEIPWHLQEQYEELKEVVKKGGFDMDKYEGL